MTKMSLADFSQLTFDGKASVLTRYGQLLQGHSAAQGERIFTYALFSFFVEVSYRFDQRVQYLRVTDHFHPDALRLDYTHIIHLN